jgi:myo-inositol 2-dehydrogenase/D-chiro-inositol 1-dehydrogenase
VNFALLGADALARPLLSAIVASSGHRLTHAVLARDLDAELLKMSPALRVSEAWDELLSNSEVDAVIVAGSDPAVLEGARQLAAAAKPLLVFPRVAQGTTWLYELGLIRDDTHVSLVPMLPARCDPRFEALTRLIADGTVGKVLQLQWDRQVQRPKTASALLLESADVSEAFLPDVDLLRSLGGNYSRVTALHSGIIGDRLSQATHSLSGDGLPEALWILTGTFDVSRWRLTATGELGTLELRCASDADDFQLLHNGVDVPIEVSGTASQLGENLLNHGIAAITGKPSRPDWSDLTRAAEICDGAWRSIRRRRTIDLHFESVSERSQFKTHMTAIGCSLLSLTLFGVIGVLMAGMLFDPREAAETKAEHAGAIFYVDDFVAGTAQLAADEADAEDRIRGLVVGMRNATFPVLIEQSADSDAETSERRRAEIVRRLTEAGAGDAPQRVQVAELKGRGFQAFMQVARLLVFVPLGLFLLLQLLLFISRPASNAPKGPPADDVAT